MPRWSNWIRQDPSKVYDAGSNPVRGANYQNHRHFIVLCYNSNMNKQQHFEESLARGLKFERDLATDTLHELFPTYVIKRYAKDPTERYGPRAFVGLDKREELVLPDFEIYNQVNNRRFYVDAKLKKQAYQSDDVSRPLDPFLTIDTKSHNEYAKTMSVYTDMDLFLLFGVESTRKIYLAQWQVNPETKRYNNEYGNSNVPIYYINDLTKIGIF